MARGDTRLWTWQVILTISMVTIPLCAHGRHSLTRHHHHHNQSSVSKEALNPRMVLSDDSAEREHLIGAELETKRPPSSTKHHRSHKHMHLDFMEEGLPVGEELTAGGAGPDQPGNPLSDDVITVEFHSQAPDIVPSDVGLDWAKAPEPQKQKGDHTAWTISDFYVYSDDDLSALDTTPEPEPTPLPPAVMEDENPLLAGSPAVPDKMKPNVDRDSSLPALPIPGPDKSGGLSLDGAMGTDGCRLGFVRSGPGVCVSQCDTEPNFCLNGGVCTVVAGIGAFCRCNVQDYIWNKGTRCDWAITEFQVLCVVVAVTSLVLLLLFMIIVFFAKRLYRLKNENKRLRKRSSKYRPQSSEPQTDGLSVSTTADGSQPNVRKLSDTPPPASQAHTHNLAYYDNIICQDEPQKQEDPAKSPQPKEEGSMNILNSHSPKHENNRPASVVHDHGHTPNNTEENTEDEGTIGLEVLLPKEAKLHSETSPSLQYDVFLYKVAKNGNSYSTSHLIPKSPKSPKTPKTPKSPKKPKSPKSQKHTKEHSPSCHEPLSGWYSSPVCHWSPRCHPSPSRHSAPGCYSSLTQHSSSHHFPSHMPTSTPPQLCQTQAPDSESSGTGRRYKRGHIHPSPSSPHLTQPPPSPSSVKYTPVSTRSLPLLS